MNEGYRKALGQVLAAKRKTSGLTKQQLALMVGINRLTVRLIERGEENPTIEILLRITQGLGASLADVLVEAERTLAGDEAERAPIPAPIQLGTTQPEMTYYITRL